MWCGQSCRTAVAGLLLEWSNNYIIAARNGRRTISARAAMCCSRNIADWTTRGIGAREAFFVTAAVGRGRDGKEDA
jgi:hypothetical protein